MTETRAVVDGLWLWRQRHPGWSPRASWPPDVTSFCVTSRGVTAALDALAPQDDAVWQRLDATPPEIVVIVKPDHWRDARLFHDRYGATVYSETYVMDHFAPGLERFQPTAPGLELPGGLLTLDDGRWRQETPLLLPEQRALVFADGMIADPEGVLRVWHTPWHENRVLPALRAILDAHEFDHVLVSHGDPVHTRADMEAALQRAPWSG